MKKQIISSAVILFLSVFNFLPFGEDMGGSLCAQNVSINTTGAPGDASAMLDVNASDKGLLIPRVALTTTTEATPVVSATISLLVYNTATAGTFPNNVVPGFYYWDGTKWNPIARQTGVLAFADFYALMPADNSATVAPGAAVEFPNAGPTSGSDITIISNSTFQLSAIGTYMVSWQVSVAEAGQLALNLNGTVNLTTVVGRATGTSQISGTRLINTTTVNSILSVVNPAGNPSALTITPLAGGAYPVSASLVITRVQ